MNKPEANRLLTSIALGDNRSTDDTAVKYWLGLMHDIRLEDALQAVAVHRRESTDWLQPAHIIRLVRAARQARITAANLVYEPIGRETGRQFLDRIAQLTRAAGDGHINPRNIGLALDPGTEAPTVPDELDAVIQARRAARAALAVACPHCRVSAGQPCTVGRHHRAGFMHPRRIEAYAAQPGPGRHR